MQTTDNDARITEIVATQLEVDPGEIGETDLLVEDHGADSLALIGVLAALEKEFRVTIQQDQMPRMDSIQGISEVLADSAAW
jgi:acyl carrier protein